MVCTDISLSSHHGNWAICYGCFSASMTWSVREFCEEQVKWSVAPKSITHWFERILFDALAFNQKMTFFSLNRDCLQDDYVLRGHLNAVNCLSWTQIVENTMICKEFSNTILFLSEFPNREKIIIQVWNQENWFKVCVKNNHRTYTGHLW